MQSKNVYVCAVQVNKQVSLYKQIVLFYMDAESFFKAQLLCFHFTVESMLWLINYESIR